MNICQKSHLILPIEFVLNRRLKGRQTFFLYCTVAKWTVGFKGGRAKVDNNLRSGCPEKLQTIHELVIED